MPPTSELLEARGKATTGLASLAGAFADWDEIDQVVDEIYAARKESRDRSALDLG